MKLGTIVGVAVAGVFAWSAGANAGGFAKHGSWFGGDKHASSSMWNGYEVRTPSSVNESAPWLANEPHMAGFSHQSASASSSDRFGDATYGTGASSGVSGFGSGGFDSTQMNRGNDTSFGSQGGTPYWLMGD
jgi:hypothetical protein